ncbi:MAG: hypothetical protein CV089_16405 [Nitrospira sp. WS110]|nr:hypothetical protein [Nitrospira sp. WS110]
MEPRVVFSGHIVGLLKEYMRDLVEQAAQDMLANERFGFSSTPYRPDQAISDLLALLDDRIESEGIQVGLPENFLHSMWSLCNEAVPYVSERLWIERNIGSQAFDKARTRELTYQALIDYIECPSDRRA